MPPKKSVEDLDAELAELEAELAALESGEALPPRKPKKPKRAEPPPAPEAEEAPAEEAPKKRFGLRRARREEAPLEAAPEPAPEPPAEEAPRRRFGFPKRAAAEAPEPVEAPAEEAPEALPPPPPAPARGGPPPLPWTGAAGAWRVSAPGPKKVEVVRRELDERGRVVAEEQVGEELVEAPAEPAPEPGRRFGLFRTGPAPPPEEGGAEAAAPGEEPPPRRRRWVIFPVLLIVALLLLALVLPALGVDPLGIGDRLGIGGGGAAPVATFSTSANLAATGQPITFDASGSRDPAGGALEHSWDFGDGGGATGAVVNHTYASRGTYTVTLTVRSAGGAQAADTEQVQVIAAPVARMAVSLGGSPLGGDNRPVAGDSELAFSGAGSTAEGGVAAYEWDFGDGARATGAEAAHTYQEPGSYRATLTVGDANGLRNSTAAAIYVGHRVVAAGEVPPTVQAAGSVNTTIEATAGGGALPFQPVQLVAVLNYTAPTGGGPLPLPDPAGVNTLTLTIYDPTGAAVATAAGPGATATVGDGSAGIASGTWSVGVSRPQGGVQPITFDLTIELRNGPA